MNEIIASIFFKQVVFLAFAIWKNFENFLSKGVGKEVDRMEVTFESFPKWKCCTDPNWVDNPGH
ncbi:hypothetical protein [Brevibacillus laterosporus]|uniref:hypothetical protein n=1 Tax=Brevibacillus laterosporus TaxID=1465 RepID=UPI000CE4A669|nr:hypothetical protein [Brevibacillus laterosporus]MED1667059.1 hypothetical protein [Brevibacillus laterosporus]MED1671947.1 hypothetical protein [Brevibacillus laterosporus]MED1721130.1 hypothetical protein [Brevibacillus laterosporus]PPA80708.1 hypothetical protein C4A76_25770 [Brevibacillus laterosporus]